MSLNVNDGEGRQALHYNRLSKRQDGFAVLDMGTGSCEVVINTGDLGDGNYAVSVQDGTIIANGTTVGVPGQPVSIPQALTEPRKDVIAATQDGSIVRIGGDQEPISPSGRALRYAERPAPPDLANDQVVPLAVISVPADATAISVEQIRDIRPNGDYHVGTINGADPASFISSTTAQTISSTWTFEGGLKSTTAPTDPADVLRQTDSSEFAGSTEFQNLENRVNTLSATDVGAVPESGGSFTGGISVAGPIDSDYISTTGTGTTGGLHLSNGIYYTSVNGVATIYSFTSEGGNGWALSDPDAVGDALTVNPNGDTTIAGALDVGGVVRSGGSALLDSLNIEDSGTALAGVDTINFDTNLTASVSGSTATVTGESGGSLASIPISDDGVSQGEVTGFDFADYISAEVNGDTARIDVSGAAYGTGGYGGGSGYGGAGSGDAGRSTVRAITHGADSTGETASTTALQDAINAADPGDRVVWGDTGTYYLDDEISITKRIELDLHEGIIESDYHDGQAWPDDQQHYMPLFRVQGSLGADYSLQEPVNRGTDQVYIQTPGDFSVGDYVILRNSTPAQGTMPGYDYMATQTRIREIENGVIYLEDNALYDYTTADYLTHANYVERPILRNIHLINRNPLTFSDEGGKVFGGFRHGIGTEFCDRPVIDNCTVEGYDSHLWTSRDDISPLLQDCAASRPMNLSGSCGEPIHIQSSRDVSVVRPTIKEARRAVDVRSGCGTITVEEPDITGVSFVGISWHSVGDVGADIIVNGGRVEAKPDDPTMDNKDGTLDQRQEAQRGRPFNSAENGTLIANDVTFVGRINGRINGSAEITGGEIYKYRNAGTVLTLGGDDIRIDGTEISAYGPLDNLVETDTTRTPSNITFTDVDFDCASSPTRAVGILNGEDISISGTATGSASGEVVRVEGGANIDIDLDNRASGGTGVPGVQVLGGEEIDITGSHHGPGAGVLFAGPATGTSIRDMRIEVTDGTATAAIGSAGTITGLSGVKIVDNDLRGAVDTIDMSDDVSGFWAVNNACSSVSYTTATSVGQVAGNMIY